MIQKRLSRDKVREGRAWRWKFINLFNEITNITMSHEDHRFLTKSQIVPYSLDLKSIFTLNFIFD